MIDTRAVVDRLQVLESLAIIPRVSSTNEVARRIVNECIENELSLPCAIIVAGEQLTGRGRNQRSWSSPAGKGIYATTLFSRRTEELALVPLQMANIVAGYLREVFSLDARIKWPNDVLVGGSKIAGILIEARIQEERAFLSIGTGINVMQVDDPSRPNATTIEALAPPAFDGLEAATIAFVEYLDRRLARPLDRAEVIGEWRSLAVHRPGDRVLCVLGDRTVDGAWAGIDDEGRALLRRGEEVVPVSAGDLILV
jgi:BirA family biotin operon repressor/biotin-[acetyl-CoA-carboxylase] ligase